MKESTKEPINVAKWKQRTEETNAKHTLQLQTDQYKQSEIVLIGSSMFERWFTSGSHYWKLFEIEEKLHCFNAGIGGDGIQNVLWRLQKTPFGKVLSNLQHLHSIVFLIGTNNIEKHSAQQIAEAMQVLLKEIHQLCPQVNIYLLSIIPRVEPKGINKKVIECNQLLETLCKDQNQLQFVNIYPFFCEKENMEQCKAELFDDHVHLNEAGYANWMKNQFYAFLKDIQKH